MPRSEAGKVAYAMQDDEDMDFATTMKEDVTRNVELKPSSTWDGESELEPGIRIGGFELESRLGEGGMAEVWSASKIFTDGKRKRRALKVMKPENSFLEEQKEMFQDEANIAGRLFHPNIAKVYGVVHETNGTFAQVLEYVDGRDLRSIGLAAKSMEEPFPIQFALMIVRDIADACSYIHNLKNMKGEAMEIIHRDISPQNIMINKDGDVKLLDFGIARAKERKAVTAQGFFKGKMGYAAPEQAMCVGVGTHSDIFSLGIVLWELLTGEKMFKSTKPEVFMPEIMNLDVTPVRKLNPDVPLEVERLVMQMLEERAPNRPTTMDHVARTIAGIISKHYPETDKAAFDHWVEQFLEPAPERRTVAMESRDTDENELPAWLAGDDPEDVEVARSETATKRIERRQNPGPTLFLEVGTDPVPTAAQFTDEPTEKKPTIEDRGRSDVEQGAATIQVLNPDEEGGQEQEQEASPAGSKTAVVFVVVALVLALVAAAVVALSPMSC